MNIDKKVKSNPTVHEFSALSKAQAFAEEQKSKGFSAVIEARQSVKRRADKMGLEIGTPFYVVITP